MTNSKSWERVKTIFHEALERPAAERPEFVEEACANELAEVRREVEALLAAHEGSEGILDAPVLNVAVQLQFAAPMNNLLIGQSLGAYRIISLLGAGGMGEVYLSEDTRLGRQVALKILPSELVHDASLVGRFQQEARHASALNHPNILTIHEVGESNGRRFIASEYVAGDTLRERLKRDLISVVESLAIAIQIVAALNAAHAAGIIHRDIKPENVILREDGLVKVLDFGLAKLTKTKPDDFHSQTATLGQIHTEPGLIMGTAAYMSPEQARGKETDARTDLWSLGVCLYEMLTGKQPFTGETTSDIIAAILKSEPASVSDFNRQFPVEFEQLIRKALRKNREDRYQTANELLVDLRQLKKRLEFAAELENSTPSNKLDKSKTKDFKLGTNQINQATTTQFSPAITDENSSLTFADKFNSKSKNSINPRTTRIILGLLFLATLTGTGYLMYPYFNRTPQNSSEQIISGKFNRQSDLVLIPGGTFMMGRDELAPFYGEPKESPAHQVTIKSFSMDRTEVTNAEYLEFVNETNYTQPSHWVDGKPPDGEELFPVVNVSQEDAKAFAAWRSKRDGIVYRLPTEAEWEYAARGGDLDNFYPWGSIWIEGRANVNTGLPKPVGSYPEGQTRWGVQDMIGNVWEWTSTPYAPYTDSNWVTPEDSKSDYVIRGGCYKSQIRGSADKAASKAASYEFVVTATARNSVYRYYKNRLLGFRLMTTGETEIASDNKPAQTLPLPSLTMPSDRASTNEAQKPVILENPSSEPDSKLYLQMSESEQLTFIREQTRRMQILIGDEPAELNDEELLLIKNEVFHYTDRTNNLSQKLFEEGLRVIYGRATQFAPLVGRAYQRRQIPPAVGIYQAMIESEYHDCLINDVGQVGLFQFKRQTATRFGLQPKDYCNVERQSEAAAHYMSNLLSDFDNQKSMAVFSFNAGEQQTRVYLHQLRERGISDRTPWAIHQHWSELEKPPIVGDNLFRYLARFFAAAIIGENPQSFDLTTPPLSTLPFKNGN